MKKSNLFLLYFIALNCYVITTQAMNENNQLENIVELAHAQISDPTTDTLTNITLQAQSVTFTSNNTSIINITHAISITNVALPINYIFIPEPHDDPSCCAFLLTKYCSCLFFNHNEYNTLERNRILYMAISHRLQT